MWKVAFFFHQLDIQTGAFFWEEPDLVEMSLGLGVICHFTVKMLIFN